jgi:hypothetical protein
LAVRVDWLKAVFFVRVRCHRGTRLNAQFERHFRSLFRPFDYARFHSPLDVRRGQTRLYLAIGGFASVNCLGAELTPPAQRAFVTAMLFTVGKSLIGTYLGRAAPSRPAAPPAR